MTKATLADNRKLAIIADLAASQLGRELFFMIHADSVFNELKAPRSSTDEVERWILQYTDTWTGIQQRTEFSTEVEMLKFMAEYLAESDGPSEEFMKRFPAEFNEPEAA